MNHDDWKTFWRDVAERSGSDFEYDHGRSPCQKEIEELSNRELLGFIDPNPSEIIFDAGCGTGGNILLLYRKVQRLIGMDYNRGAIERSQRNIVEHEMMNVQLLHGGITHTPLPDCSVDKVICMSVLQYLDETEVREAFAEFARILKGGGLVILHVKNLSSVYLSSLWVMKKLKSLLRGGTRLEYFRSYHWYLRQLTALGFELVDYNSFNWFVIEGMPRRLRSFLRGFEFRHYKSPIFKSKFIRRHGSDLKIKVRMVKKLSVKSPARQMG